MVLKPLISEQRNGGAYVSMCRIIHTYLRSKQRPIYILPFKEVQRQGELMFRYVLTFWKSHEIPWHELPNAFTTVPHKTPLISSLGLRRIGTHSFSGGLPESNEYVHNSWAWLCFMQLLLRSTSAPGNEGSGWRVVHWYQYRWVVHYHRTFTHMGSFVVSIMMTTVVWFFFSQIPVFPTFTLGLFTWFFFTCR